MAEAAGAHSTAGHAGALALPGALSCALSCLSTTACRGQDVAREDLLPLGESRQDEAAVGVEVGAQRREHLEHAMAQEALAHLQHLRGVRAGERDALGERAAKEFGHARLVEGEAHLQQERRGQ